MSFKRTVLLFSLVWVAGISFLHAWLNLGVFRKSTVPPGAFRVGFLPVT